MNESRRSVCTALLATLCVGAISCGGSTTSPFLLPCSGPVTVSVGSGTTPRFEWQPACRAHFFAVYYADPVPPGATSGDPVWYVQSSNETGSTFGPGFQYGVLPSGGQTQLAAKPLVVGQHYLVSVWREDGPQNATLAGQVVFVP